MRTVEFKAPRPKFKLYEVRYNRQLDANKGAWFTYREVPSTQYGNSVVFEVWQQLVFAKSPADAATQANKLRLQGSFNFHAPKDPTKHAWDTAFVQGHAASGRFVMATKRNGMRKKIQVAHKHGITVLPKYLAPQSKVQRKRMAGNPYKRSRKMYLKGIIPMVVQNHPEEEVSA
jgi:hypothetical protein